MTFYFAYYGGKSREFNHIKHLIEAEKARKGDIEFVEPFCGSCATSLKVSTEGLATSYRLNDIDQQLTAFLLDVRERRTSARYFEYTTAQCVGMDRAKHKRLITEEKEDPLLTYFFRMKVYRFRRDLWHEDLNGKQYKHDQRKYLTADTFFSAPTTRITCQDFRAVLEEYRTNDKAVLYLDPPYMDSFNAGYTTYDPTGGRSSDSTGLIIDNTSMYIDILRFMQSCRCAVIMIINGNSLMREVYSRFIVGEYKKAYVTTHITKSKEGAKIQKKHHTTHLLVYKPSTEVGNGRLRLKPMKKEGWHLDHGGLRHNLVYVDKLGRRYPTPEGALRLQKDDEKTQA